MNKYKERIRKKILYATVLKRNTTASKIYILHCKCSWQNCLKKCELFKTHSVEKLLLFQFLFRSCKISTES